MVREIYTLISDVTLFFYPEIQLLLQKSNSINRHGSLKQLFRLTDIKIWILASGRTSVLILLTSNPATSSTKSKTFRLGCETNAPVQLEEKKKDWSNKKTKQKNPPSPHTTIWWQIISFLCASSGLVRRRLKVIGTFLTLQVGLWASSSGNSYRGRRLTLGRPFREQISPGRPRSPPPPPPPEPQRQPPLPGRARRPGDQVTPAPAGPPRPAPSAPRRPSARSGWGAARPPPRQVISEPGQAHPRPPARRGVGSGACSAGSSPPAPHAVSPLLPPYPPRSRSRSRSPKPPPRMVPNG